MKKVLALLSLLMLLSAAGCTASNQTYYEQAQLYLGCGDYTAAAELFSQLGEYRDSADYALYAAGLQAIKSGQYALAQTNLMEVDPFKSSGRYLRYLEALMLEKAGSFDEAQALYEGLGSFEDCPQRVELLLASLPERCQAQARTLMDEGRTEEAMELLQTLHGYGNSAAMLEECRQRLEQKAYTAAKALYDQGAYEEALTAFEALGESLDAAAQAAQCREAIYAALEERYDAVTMSTAAALLEDYAALGDYRDSKARVDALVERYTRTVALLQQDKPWVKLGQYAVGESGALDALTWRVLSVEGTVATLLCDTVIDATAAGQAIELTLTSEEKAAVLSVSLPTMKELSALTGEEWMASATPYAVAQGVRHHSDGRAWWWLGDTAGSDRNVIVWYNGRIIQSGVNTAEKVVGVRPLMKLSLEDYVLTQGDGSREQPYQ